MGITHNRSLLILLLLWGIEGGGYSNKVADLIFAACWFCFSGVELYRRASSTGSFPMEESRQGLVQGEERLDHPSNQSVGEQQAGS